MAPESVEMPAASVAAGSEEEYRAARRAQRLSTFDLLTQAAIGLMFAGVLVGLQFAAPADSSELTAGVSTLAIAILAFYFGRRLSARRDRLKEPELQGIEEAPKRGPKLLDLSEADWERLRRALAELAEESPEETRPPAEEGPELDDERRE
jgi:hypothetical protein